MDGMEGSSAVLVTGLFQKITGQSMSIAVTPFFWISSWVLVGRWERYIYLWACRA